MFRVVFAWACRSAGWRRWHTRADGREGRTGSAVVWQAREKGGGGGNGGEGEEYAW